MLQKKNASDFDIYVSQHIARNEVDINETFKRVSIGELEIVETITSADKELTRRVFGAIAAVGIAEFWGTAGKATTDALVQVAAEDDIAGPEFGVGPDKDKIRELFPNFDLGNVPSGLVQDLKTGYERQGYRGLALMIMSYVFYESFHYPQPETGVYDISTDMFGKIKWVYRYWFNQLEVAERGSGLEEHFLNAELKSIPVSDLAPWDRMAVDRSGTVSLSAAGDLLAVDALLDGDTSHLFDGISDFFSSADIVSANLESTVDPNAEPGRSQETGMPARMNTTRDMFDKFITDGGVNFFPTATNHAMDYEAGGVRATLEVLHESGQRFSGTAGSQEEQDSVVIVEKNNVKVALLSFTFDLNGFTLPADEPYLANEVRFNDVDPAPDYSLVEQQVAKAREEGADFIVAYPHWGWEFEMYPHVNITQVARDLVDRGIDVILGNHAHVSQPAEIIERPGKAPALVIYAFGDFVSYHPESRNSKLAYAVKFNVRVEEKDGRTYAAWENLEALPMYIVNARTPDGGFDCRIVKLETVLANPQGFGLTEREISELPHLRDVVWDRILAPLAHIPAQ